jgi:hypothetical protein
VSDALREEQGEIAAEGTALDAERASIRAAEEDLNERIVAHRRLGDELAQAYPSTAVEAGEYREVVTRVGTRVDSVSREIRLYRFSSMDDLRLVAAHEFGHALGLGHSATAGATMYPSVSSCNAGNRTLDADDVAGVQFLYPPGAGVPGRIQNLRVVGS